ncbi:DUF2304 family protein [Candidatus Gracilibacteria bacterium]|nr:DUF2304 family protein [Candidatus Gracilibacteria bacterium]
MNLLQLFFIISGVIIFILALDIARKQKFNALHFLVFLAIGSGLLLFTLSPSFLDFVGGIFGLQRGADALVYGSIIFLLYFVLLLLSKVEGNKNDMTYILRQLTINSCKKKIHTDILILVRAYNEGPVIAQTLKSIYDAGYKDILVIDDGSTDDTIEQVESLGHDRIVLMSHLQNRGAGAALETAFAYIRKHVECRYVVTFDADGQHDIQDLKGLGDYIQKHPKVDVFLGSRFLKKRTVGIPLGRRILLKGGILFTAVMSRIVLSDAHNGFRVFKSEAIDKISLTIDGMGYASELIDIIGRLRIPYKEIPVKIRYTQYSLEKGQKNGNAWNVVISFIWNKFFK